MEMESRLYPLVSILIPNYNYVNWVEQAVDSAVAQTYPNVEVLVSDNCSTDGAWELLNERYGAEPRVRLNQNERNLGMAGNFDVVLAKARGDYVLCLSSDDFLMPNHVELLAAVFHRRPELDIVYSTAYFTNEDGKITGMRQMPGQFPVSYEDARDELVENFTTVCPVCFPCALVKRDVMQRPGICGDPASGQTARDWEAIMRMCLAGMRFGYVAQPTMAVRIHKGQVTGDEYHFAGKNISDFVAYVERYMDEPEWIARMRGRELGVARLIRGLVAFHAQQAGGTSPLPPAETANYQRVADRLEARAAEYQPARVREAKISVIVETSGAPSGLMSALDSLAAQTHRNWEVCVVDHGAINVEGLIRGHRVGPRASYVRQPVSNGPGAARNLGLRMIRGEYVAFLDTESRFAPDHLEKAVDTIEQSGAKAALATARLVLEDANRLACDGSVLGSVEPFGGDASDVARLKIAQSVRLDALVFYRGLIDQTVKFNEVPFLDDWEYLIRLAGLTPFVSTGATTLNLVTRVSLVGCRLAALHHTYLALVDAIYRAYPMDEAGERERAAHRSGLAHALDSIVDWTREPRGLAAFHTYLAGRNLYVSAAR